MNAEIHKQNYKKFIDEERPEYLEKIRVQQDELEMITTDFLTYVQRKNAEYDELLKVHCNQQKLQDELNRSIEELSASPKDIKLLNAKRTCELNLLKCKNYMETIEKRRAFLVAEHFQDLIDEKRSVIESLQTYLSSQEAFFTKEEARFASKPVKREVTMFDDPRDIQRALRNNVTQKFNGVEITKENLHTVQKCIRSRDNYKDKADFLIRARIFESESDAPSESEKYSETSEALFVLNAYITANASLTENGVTTKGDPLIMKELYDLCEILIESPYFLSEEKMGFAVTYFLVEEFSYAYSLFHRMLQTSTVRINDKAEACKFLYYSGREMYLQDIEKYTIEILNNNELSDEYRYEIIASYVSADGIKSKYLIERLPNSGVDIELITNLFKHFTTLPVHPDKLILAYSFLLEQTCDESLKPSIEDKLLAMCTAEYPTLSKTKAIRVRADAADVLYRISDRLRDEAGRIITLIGQEENELDRTVYSNAENVHLMNDSMITYLEKNFSSVPQKFTKIDDVVRDIEVRCEKSGLNLAKRLKIRKSMDRILLDTSKFTKHRITLSTVLIVIYNKIYTFKHKSQLLARLLEEFIDMSETCASGHIKRLINVMVGFDEELVGIMNLSDQLEANIKTRINKIMNDDPNRDSLIEMMESSKDEFAAYVNKAFSSIRNELIVEFVDAGFLSLEKFEEVSSGVLKKFL